MQIVSLITDFGSKDYFVADLKARILSQNSNCNIVDISHEIEPYDIVQAAFFIKNIFPSFPLHTIHIIAVNNTYRKNSEYICFEKDNQFFIGPNNGVYSLVFEDLNFENVFVINPPSSELNHYYHLYAHAVAYLSHKLPINEIGPKVTVINQRLELKPVVTSQQIRATIIHIDQFENVIINLKKEQFEKIRAGRNFELYYKQNDPINYLSRNYSDVAIGDPLAFFNTYGYLEIAINMGKASTMFSLNRNETIQINFF